MIRSLCLSLVCVVLATGCGKSSQTTSTPATLTASTSSAATPVRIASYDEIMQAIAAHQGQIVVVDLWSTSCDPCVAEFPNLVKLHQQHAADGVTCVSVSFDYEGGRKKPADVQPRVQAFLDQQGATFENFMGSEDSETLSKKFGIPAIPVVLVFDRAGNKAATFGTQGEFTYADVNAKVDELLKP